MDGLPEILDVLRGSRGLEKLGNLFAEQPLEEKAATLRLLASDEAATQLACENTTGSEAALADIACAALPHCLPHILSTRQRAFVTEGAGMLESTHVPPGTTACLLNLVAGLLKPIPASVATTPSTQGRPVTTAVSSAAETKPPKDPIFLAIANGGGSGIVPVH